jgi:hypothetical protein
MQAQEARLRKLIEGTTQYVVPLFQLSTALQLVGKAVEDFVG